MSVQASHALPGGWPSPSGTRPDRLGERYPRAVLPEPFQRVVRALLGMLNVDHDVEIVQENPAALPLSLPAHRPDPGQAHSLFDLVDDRTNLAVVRGRAE